MDSGRLEPMVREVRRLAAERPDFVYIAQPEHGTAECYYYGADGKGNGTGCIIGEASKALGASREILQYMDRSRSLEQALGFALRRLNVNMMPDERDALQWLGFVQGNQDMGMSWSEAVEEADSPNVMSDLA